MATPTFWTITYADEPCEDDDTMRFASLTWDCENEENDSLIQKDLNEYHHFRPVSLGWLNELLTHMGDNHYIYNIRQKWEGEFLIYYREKQYRTEHEDACDKRLREHYAEYTDDEEAEWAYLEEFYSGRK